MAIGDIGPPPLAVHVPAEHEVQIGCGWHQAVPQVLRVSADVCGALGGCIQVRVGRHHPDPVRK